MTAKKRRTLFSIQDNMYEGELYSIMRNKDQLEEEQEDQSEEITSIITASRICIFSDPLLL
jgi:hypothetical protein